jgi:hypothetical protein
MEENNNKMDLSKINADELLKEVEELRKKLDFSSIRNDIDKYLTKLEIEQGIKDKDGNLIKKEEEK